MKETDLSTHEPHCYKGAEHCANPSGFSMANYLAINNDSYKSLHEAFVSNNTGTNPLELLVVVSPWTFTTFCIQLLATFDCTGNKFKIFMFFVEFITSLMIQIYVTTLGSDYCYQYVIALILIAIFLFILKFILAIMNGCESRPNLLDSWMVSPDTNIYTFITNVRTQLCILVCISILAVDFPIFPRRYAKTETYGYGLMDTGIGFFMLVNGLVAPETKRKYQFSRGNFSAFKKSIQSSISLLLIGIIRVIAVKSLNYQEHLTEYGVHWNFFFSLAFAKIGCSLVFMLFPPIYSGFIAIILSISYQILLQFGLDYIIFNGFDGKDSRSNFFDANREGLVSCVSFTCLYLFGVQVGYIIFRSGVTIREWMRTTFVIFCISTSLAVTAYFCHVYIAPASRRLVNITYMTWLSAFLFFLVFEWMVVDLIQVFLKYHSGRNDAKYYTSKASLINKTISYNFLLAFLLANLLTGIVNMSMTTIYASNIVSYVVLTIYLLVICVTMIICYWKKWQLKLG